MPASSASRTPAAKRARRRSLESQAEFKAEMLAFAKGLYRDQGWEAVSIRAVTDAFGMSPMSFYGYFDSKQDLIKHILIDVFDELLQRLLACTDGRGSPLRLLEAHVRAYIDYWESHPQHYRMVYVAAAGLPGEAAVKFDEDPVYQRLLALGRERVMACARGPATPPTALQMAPDLLFVKALGYLHATLAVERYAVVDRRRLRREII